MTTTILRDRSISLARTRTAYTQKQPRYRFTWYDLSCGGKMDLCPVPEVMSLHPLTVLIHRAEKLRRDLRSV